MEVILYVTIALLGSVAIFLGLALVNLNNQKRNLQARIEELTQTSEKLNAQLHQLQMQNHQAQLSLATYQEKLSSQEAQLAESKKRIEILETENKQLREEKARSEETIKNLQNQLENQKNEIENLHQQLKKEFELLSARLLEQNTQKLAEQNRQVLTPLINPVQEYLKQLKEVEFRIRNYYDNENRERASLKTVVEALAKQNTEISQTTEKLTKALTTQVKEQGIWGEMILERLLELAGLEKDREYKIQFRSGDKQPDVIIYLPDNRHIIVDAKVTLTSLLEYYNAPNEEERQKHANDILRSLERHYKELSQRDYEKIPGINSPDFVLMFIPIESLMHIIHKYKPQLYDDALRRKVMLVTPTSLLVVLRIVNTFWQQHKRQKEIDEILKSVDSLYDKIRVFTVHLHELGNALQKAQNKFDEAVKSLTTGRGSAMSILEKKLRPYITPKEEIKHFLPFDEEEL